MSTIESTQPIVLGKLHYLLVQLAMYILMYPISGYTL